MKLEVGDYVRTNFGIKKIYEINKKATKWKYLYKSKKQDGDGCVDLCYLNEDNILKASKNIIDLIEVGDYVNGYKIDYINLNCETPFLRSNQPYRVDNTLYSTLIEKGKNYNQPLHFYNEDIKSILTKEQFESMAYEVEE